ncbi:MAG: hypothetical protein CMF68_15260 [Magnetovibrio sp.]|nr:hypothetical protein [Magnetovibrio sp.]|tara:strand:- start:207 stop:785 length:579 start_codon:yes stop_codon:yes gene_type:complete
MDEWTLKYQPTFPVDQLHAIGIIGMSFAMAEKSIHRLTWLYSGLDFKIGSLHTFDISPGTMANKLRYLANQYEKNTNLRAAILYGIDCFEICQANRNRVSHFLPMGGDFNQILSQPNRGKEPTARVYEADVGTLRKTADETFMTAGYLSRLHHLIRPDRIAAKDTSTLKPDALPDRCQLPTLLPMVIQADQQ